MDKYKVLQIAAPLTLFGLQATLNNQAGEEWRLAGTLSLPSTDVEPFQALLILERA